MLLQSFSLVSEDERDRAEWVLLNLTNLFSLHFYHSSFMSGTCLAVNLIRAVVFTVIEEVTAQVGADAPAVCTQELILLTCGIRWSSCSEQVTGLGKKFSKLKVILQKHSGSL